MTDRSPDPCDTLYKRHRFPAEIISHAGDVTLLATERDGIVALLSAADGYGVPFRHGPQAMTSDTESRAL